MKSKDLSLAAGTTLAERFAADYASVSNFYAYDPADPVSYQRRLAVLRKTPSPDRAVLIDALHSYNNSLGGTTATRRNIGRLRAGNSAAIVTGQQAGVLTGPLYTIYKTITAVLLARKCEDEFGVPVVPVFWVASEDHDYYEINHINLYNGRGGITRLQLPYTPDGKQSVGHLPVLPAALYLIEELEQITPDGEFKGEIAALLRRTARTAGNLGEWCARLMTELFGRYGVVCFDPLESAGRIALRRFFARALRANRSVSETIVQATERLTKHGYKPQLALEADNANLFLYVGEERLILARQEDGLFRLRDHPEKCYSESDLLALADGSPNHFSPNAALRPIAQDMLFPTLAYVAGPGEIAYYAQLKDVYPLFDREMPIIYPRLSLTLVESDDAAVFSRLGLDPAAVLQTGPAALYSYLERVDPVGIDRVFDALENDFSSAYTDLADTLTTLNPNLRQLSEGNLGRILYQVNYLRRKAKQRLRQNNRPAIRAFENALAKLMPNGQKQERIFNICPYLFRYGPGFIDMLTEHLNLDSFAPKMLTLEDEEDGYC